MKKTSKSLNSKKIWNKYKASFKKKEIVDKYLNYSKKVIYIFSNINKNTKKFEIEISFWGNNKDLNKIVSQIK